MQAAHHAAPVNDRKWICQVLVGLDNNQATSIVIGHLHDSDKLGIRANAILIAVVVVSSAAPACNACDSAIGGARADVNATDHVQIRNKEKAGNGGDSDQVKSHSEESVDSLPVWCARRRVGMLLLLCVSVGGWL